MYNDTAELKVENFDFLNDTNDSADDIEEVVLKHNTKKTVFSDIMTVQCILCIILAILAVTANILIPKITKELVNEYQAANAADNAINSELYSIVLKISNMISDNAEV